MSKRFCMAVLLCMALSVSAYAATFTPGTYEGKGRGYSENLEITVKVTVDEEKITKVEIEGAERRSVNRQE